MLDFETVYRKHGETFIWDFLHIWERGNKIEHPPMTLEDRWSYFLRATNDDQDPSRAPAASSAIH